MGSYAAGEILLVIVVPLRARDNPQFAPPNLGKHKIHYNDLSWDLRRLETP